MLRQLREESTAPVIVLSARHDGEMKVAAFDLGADDYVTKPFGLRELIARVRVRLRQGEKAAQGGCTFRAKDLAVNFERRRLQVGGRDVRLTRNEFDLLGALIQADGAVLTVASRDGPQSPWSGPECTSRLC